MESNDFVSIDHILAEVTQTLDDRDFRNGFSRGWYVSRIQDALQELSFDTYFQRITLDYDVPKDKLQLELPKGIFNIREIYLYNSDCCAPTTSQKVWWKRLLNNTPGGTGYTAIVKDRSGQATEDPFIPDYRYDNGSFYGWWTQSKYAAALYDGKIMLSSDCRSFSKVRIVANGMGGEIGDLPIIPRFFERAINDYVEERYCNAMKHRNPRTYRPLWSDAYNRLNDPRDGSWKKAKMRISSMDTFTKESLENYIGSMYHKG